MIDLPEPLWRFVSPEPNSGCWLYDGTMESRNGYGRVYWNGKRRQFHKVIWEALKGVIPKGLILDHRCRVRFCGNPEHLELVTVRVNTLRGIAALFKRKEDYHAT